MAEQSKFSKILEKNRVELAQLQGKSSGWFDSKVLAMRDVREMRAETLLRGDAESKGNRIIPGHMYMFLYDPKHKETLPYYDMFPLVFPFSAEPGGFRGINLHYLDYRTRALLLDRLMEFRTNKSMDETTRLRLSWQLLSGLSRFAIAQPCVKHYLYSHVRSPFKAVNSSDWATAMLVPMERFAKASRAQVWAESNKIIRKP